MAGSRFAGRAERGGIRRESDLSLGYQHKATNIKKAHVIETQAHHGKLKGNDPRNNTKRHKNRFGVSWCGWVRVISWIGNRYF